MKIVNIKDLKDFISKIPDDADDNEVLVDLDLPRWHRSDGCTTDEIEVTVFNNRLYITAKFDDI